MSILWVWRKKLKNWLGDMAQTNQRRIWQVQVQRCGNVSCLQNHQVHATDSRQKLLQCTGGCPAGEAVGHERPAVGSRLADVDTELTARLSAERAARNDKVLTAPVPFGTRLAGYLRNQILIFLYRQFHIKV